MKRWPTKLSTYIYTDKANISNSKTETWYVKDPDQNPAHEFNRDLDPDDLSYLGKPQKSFLGP